MKRDDIDIRPATLADTPALLEARRLMFEELDDFESGLLDRIGAEFVEYLNREMPTGRVSGWIAEDRRTGGWVGAVAIEWFRLPTTPRIHRELRALLFGLYVRPEYRRRGIAKSLVNAAVAAAREAGAGAVLLHASDFGRPLYESLGFKQTSEMRLILDGDAPQGCC